MSPLSRCGGFSTSLTGFEVSPWILRERWKIPCRITSAFLRLAALQRIATSHCSTRSVVTSSSFISPRVGEICASMIQR